jgi:hypothetical protein
MAHPQLFRSMLKDKPALHLAVEVVHPPSAACDRFIQDRTALHFLDVLAKVADRQLLGDRDRALVGGFLADHHTEERCLARPIGTDQPTFSPGFN